jgi:hypothetical protein
MVQRKGDVGVLRDVSAVIVGMCELQDTNRSLGRDLFERGVAVVGGPVEWAIDAPLIGPLGDDKGKGGLIERLPERSPGSGVVHHPFEMGFPLFAGDRVGSL